MSALAKKSPHLLPIPKRLEWGNGRFDFGNILPPLSWSHLEFWLAGTGTVRVVRDSALSPQAYRMEIDSSGATLWSGDDDGVFYAAMTLRQLLRECGGIVPFCKIEDAPDFAVRGVMWDISRDKVPTMNSLRKLIDFLAEWKVNQLQLYMEHTFAYSAHKKVWENSSPMTEAEIRELDAYCKDRRIELVPNQNSFGHLERWFVHPEYRRFSAAPDGFLAPWGEFKKDPTTLDPTAPEAFTFVTSLHEELLPCFSSKMVQVGGDEPWDLGHGKTKEPCDRLGRGKVYLDFLLKLHGWLRKRKRTMLFWGDIVAEHPDLIPSLPRDLIAVDWGYEDDHDFEKNAARLAEEKIPFYLCAGTCAWTSITGRADVMKRTILRALRAGRKHGALGFLNTNWGDLGHLEQLPISYPGLAFGAAASWCLETNETADFGAALGAHLFGNEDAGKILVALGETHTVTGVSMRILSLFGFLLHKPFFPVRDKDRKQASADSLCAAAENLQVLGTRFRQLDLRCDDAEILRAEIEQTVNLALHACRQGILRLEVEGESVPNLSPKDKASLAEEFVPLVEEHERLWTLRNRLGGLVESSAKLRRTLAIYRGQDPGEPDPFIQSGS